jgi:hypothetical protein
MKSKEEIKTLMLHIIGLVVHLSSNGHTRVSFVGAILKKDAHELKSYCHELGMVVEPTKTKGEEGKEVDDFIISFTKKREEAQ